MSELSELERFISVRIIQEDAESIYSLLQTEKDSIFSMEVVPYYVLFVHECQEYMGKNFLPQSITEDFKDIRDHIKMYSERFGKSRKRILFTDRSHDNEFKGKLKFAFLKKLNIHLNLGTYWTDDYHVIGNTQQIANSLSIKEIFYNKRKGKFYHQGFHIGSFVSSVRDGFAEVINPPNIDRQIFSIKINNYYDINTDNKNMLFSKKMTKEQNLFYLHLLCSMNFVKYVLSTLFKEDNTWIFRVEYIVTYYTLRAIERLKSYCENNNDITIDMTEVSKMTLQGEKLFNTKLRNCMMHYNLENAGVITIENADKPFYGIIENCFDGMSYQEYLCDLHNLSDRIIKYLESKFDFTNIKFESFNKE